MRHLSEEELFEALAEGKEGGEPEHLKECPECRGAYEELAAFAVRAASPPGLEPDWEAQRRAVLAKVARPRFGWGRLAGAAAGGAALAAALVLIFSLSRLDVPKVSAPNTLPPPEPGAAAGPSAASEPADQEEVALSWWHPQEPLDEDFDGFMDFMVPVAEEDIHEKGSDADLHSDGGPAGRALVG
jgi:hypothetical protein